MRSINVCKEFCMGGSKVKTVLYFPYTARCEQCYYNNTEPDMCMAKNWEDFRRFSSAGTEMDKIVNVTMSLSGFDVMYQQTWHNWYIYNDGKEILYNT